MSFEFPGKYKVVFRVTDRHGSADSEAREVNVSPGTRRGYVRLAGKGARYFTDTNGLSVFLVGSNVCWGGQGGVDDYREWLPRFAEQGCNLIRVWASPHWATFGLVTIESGYDRIDQTRAAHLDTLMDIADASGMLVQLVIDSYNFLKKEERWHGIFHETPFNSLNGGPLDEPMDYFTHPDSLRAYKNRLRYMVARWGHRPGLLAWELWNEADLVDDYDSETMARWHADMIGHLKSIDPWRHPVTTSFARPEGDPEVDMLPQLDFVQTHVYNMADVAGRLQDIHQGKEAAMARPFFVGEFGHDSELNEVSAALDPHGISIHNGLYASVGMGAAGGGLPWFWDSYIEKFDLYSVYGPFCRWIEGIDFASQKMTPLSASAAWQDPAADHGTWPVAIAPTGEAWEPAPFNQPVRVVVSTGGEVSHEVEIPSILFGSGFTTMRNPVTFVLDAPRPTSFAVEVGGVSGWGGGRLVVQINGVPVLDENFPVPEDTADRSTMRQYAGVYQAGIPEGKHEVTVSNEGSDWFSVLAISIPALARPTIPPLRVSGVRGETQALVWAQNRLHTWSNKARNLFEIPVIKGAVLDLEGFSPGTWVADQIDTQTGEIVSSADIAVSSEGKASMDLPDIMWDAAWRMHKTDNPETGE